MKNNKTFLAFLGFVIIAGTSFFAGMKYQQSRQPAFFRQFSGNRQLNGQMQGRVRIGGGQVTGEIVGRDDKSITVKMQDGSTKIVLLSDSTTYNKTAEGSSNDLKVGERVGVFGTENSDKSVTAQNIQLNPLMRNITGVPSR
jgi:hypothetical protein